ncbi:MAG: DUF4339 domain-containing protein [Planctomycetes bacterium]|nr:DUF4339 domain-containing protein [Planctomycetota bacterium]
MGSRWRFQVFAEELGPVGLAGLAQYVAQGVITRDTLVRSEDAEDWAPASSIEGLFSGGPPTSPRESPASAEPTDTSRAVRPGLLARCSRTATPWTLSLVVHAVLLTVLGLWALPLIEASGVLEWELEFSEELPDPSTVLSAELDPTAAANADVQVSADPSGLSNVASVAPDFALATVTLTARPIRGLNAGSWAGLPPVQLDQEVKPDPQAFERGAVVQALDIEGAVNGVVGGIRKEMAEQDLLVVWLMDASLSLWDDRQQMAQLLGPFYDEFDGLDTSESPLLMNAAVAYGARTQELVSPIRFGKRILGAMREAPIDPSGLENVMLAVQQCVNEYRSRFNSGSTAPAATGFCCR